METSIGSQMNIEIEKPSSVLRVMKVKVPAQIVKKQIDRGLASVQKTANLKGFRPGHAPIAIIKQHYGDDVRHRVFHSLIDETFEKAIVENQIRTVGRPKIETPDHQTGEGSHDHTLSEDKDLVFTATFEIMPEIEVRDYTGIPVTREIVEVTEQDVQKVVDGLHQSQGQLTPVSSGLIGADGVASSRPVQDKDFVDVQFSGSLVTDSGLEPRADLSGTKLIEIGAKEFMPGFEDQLLGMRRGESKTFRLDFPQGEAQGELSGRQVEFTVNVNEIKEKQLPVLDDELVNQMGYESLENLRTKAREYLLREKQEESDRAMKNELFAQLIEKNPFEIPSILIESQTRVLAQEFLEELQKQGHEQAIIQNALQQGMEDLKKRAESQVRGTLILESIAHQEKFSVSAEDLELEIDRFAKEMQLTRAAIDSYYAKNPGKKGDLEFRLRQDLTLKFLLAKAKVKSAPAKEK